MISPFTRLNTAAIRADRRARLRRTVSDALCLATLALIAVVLANAMLTTALALPDLAAQALALKGM